MNRVQMLNVVFEDYIYDVIDYNMLVYQLYALTPRGRRGLGQ